MNCLPLVAMANRMASEAFKALARNSMLGFMVYTNPEYQVNWHHALIAQKLDEMVFGDLRRLMVFVPPQHGKSELVSRHLPAFVLGQDPDAEIIGVSYGSDLATEMNTDCQRVMDTNPYRELFPASRIPSDDLTIKNKRTYRRTMSQFDVSDHDGGYFSRGVAGGILGKGFKWGIIDDPHKDVQDIESPVSRRKLIKFYNSVFLSRQTPDSRIIILMTRWHPDDLAGELLNRARKDSEADQWEVIRLPAIADDDLHPDDPRDVGDALWEGKYDKPFLMTMKANMLDDEWDATYQQHPKYGRAGMFQTDNIKIVPYPPECESQCRFYDLASTKKASSAFTAGVKLGITNDNHPVILDLSHDRLDATEIHDLILENAKIDGKDCPIVIEAERGAIHQMPYLLRDKRLNGYDLILQTPKGDKVTRATPLAIRMKHKDEVWMVENHIWNPKVKHEMKNFAGNASTYKDIVDACSGGYEFLVGDAVDDGKQAFVLEI